MAGSARTGVLGGVVDDDGSEDSRVNGFGSCADRETASTVDQVGDRDHVALGAAEDLLRLLGETTGLGVCELDATLKDLKHRYPGPHPTVGLDVEGGAIVHRVARRLVWA